MKLLVIGATGGTGREIVSEALRKGHEVLALARAPDQAREMLEGATIVQGDARETPDLTHAMHGCDGVISALGPPLTPFRRVTLLSRSTAATLDAMRDSGVDRIVCITGMGAGDSRGHGGFLYDRVIQPLLLQTIYADKDRQEELLRSGTCDWTVVRPTVLTDGPGTGRVKAVTELEGVHGGKISRADVAAFIVEEIEQGTWSRKTPLITSY